MTRSTRRASEGADQFVLEVGIADEEAGPLHRRTIELIAEPGSLQVVAEQRLLADVTQAQPAGGRGRAGPK